MQTTPTDARRSWMGSRPQPLSEIVGQDSKDRVETEQFIKQYEPEARMGADVVAIPDAGGAAVHNENARANRR